MFDVVEELVALAKAFRAARIEYAVCGGLAVMIHGFIRATEDIDLLIEERDLEKARAVAASCGFRLRGTQMMFRAGAKLARVLKTSPESEDYLVLDLMLVTDATRTAWESRMDLETQWGPICTVSREALKAMKRQAGRPQDLVDIERMENPDDLG
jgi:hypothetical protein